MEEEAGEAESDYSLAWLMTSATEVAVPVLTWAAAGVSKDMGLRGDWAGMPQWRDLECAEGGRG